MTSLGVEPKSFETSGEAMSDWDLLHEAKKRLDVIDDTASYVEPWSTYSAERAQVLIDIGMLELKLGLAFTPKTVPEGTYFYFRPGWDYRFKTVVFQGTDALATAGYSLNNLSTPTLLIHPE